MHAASAYVYGLHPLRLLFWLVAAFWVTRIWAAQRGLPQVDDLLKPEFDRSPAGTPRLRVIVPACNEEQGIAACIESLVAQEYGNLEIVAVDDRSTDRTGEHLDELALRFPERLCVLHIQELPAGWLGKPHAMQAAAALNTGGGTPDWLLFTDGDVLFRTDSLRIALARAVATQSDHFVLAPTTIILSWDEAALLSYFQSFALWAARPWRVTDPRARDAIGIGAFNLLRRTAYEQIGGFAALRMAVIEDLGIARRVKQAGLRQRFAFGCGLVRVHWATGATGLIRTMTKNIFAAARFNPWQCLLGCAGLAALSISPFFLVWIPGFQLPAALAILSLAYGYVLLSRHSDRSAWYVLLAPFAAAAFIYAMLRSMWFTLRQGGIIWRGTFYPLAELRRNMSPL